MNFKVTICKDSFLICDPQQLLLLNMKQARKILKLSRQYSPVQEYEDNTIALQDALQDIEDSHKKFPAVVKKAQKLYQEYKVF